MAKIVNLTVAWRGFVKSCAERLLVSQIQNIFRRDGENSLLSISEKDF